MPVDGVQNSIVDLFQTKVVKEKTNQSLGMNEFLQLIAAQMQNQDFTNPMSDTDMIAQMAQFSTLDAMQSLMSITTTSYSAGLLGKEVTIAKLTKTGDMLTKTGIVTGVGLYENDPIIFIDNEEDFYNLGDIMVVGENPIRWPKPSDVTYSPTMTLGDITLKEGFAWEEPNTPLTVPGGSYSMIYTPADTENSTPVTKDVAVTVNKATPQDIIWPEPEAVIYSPTLTLGDINLGEGFAWKNPDTLLTAPGGSYSVTYTPADTDNYKTVSRNVEVTVTGEGDTDG